MRLPAVLAVIVAAGAAATGARADGLPVLGIDVGATGVTTAGSPYRWIAIGEGRTTLVERVARNGGSVVRWARLPGTFTIPAVAYDGSASGVSADAKRLVLIEPRSSFPRARTRFVLLDANGLGVYRTITLRGDFSFDALSPHGRTMFLINYTSADPNSYQVRAYDLAAFRLLPGSITDPAEHEDAMHGAPITRLTSEDGRWAYTLYDGAGKSPFVHALDTATRRAHCVDLPILKGRRDLWQLRLHRAGSGGIEVKAAAGPVAAIDTTAFTAGPPPAPQHSRDVRPWLLYGAATALAALLGTLAGRVRRRRPATA